MKITLEPTTTEDQPLSSYVKVTIETKRDDYTIHDLFEEVIEPALIAWGYDPSTVEKLFESDES